MHNLDYTTLLLHQRVRGYPVWVSYIRGNIAKGFRVQNPFNLNQDSCHHFICDRLCSQGDLQGILEGADLPFSTTPKVWCIWWVEAEFDLLWGELGLDL